MTPKPPRIINEEQFWTHMLDILESPSATRTIVARDRLIDFIESEMKRYAKERVAKFAEKIRPEENPEYTNSWNDCVGETQRAIDAELKLEEEMG